MNILWLTLVRVEVDSHLPLVIVKVLGSIIQATIIDPRNDFNEWLVDVSVEKFHETIIICKNIYSIVQDENQRQQVWKATSCGDDQELILRLKVTTLV